MCPCFFVSLSALRTQACSAAQFCQIHFTVTWRHADALHRGGRCLGQQASSTGWRMLFSCHAASYGGKCQSCLAVTSNLTYGCLAHCELHEANVMAQVCALVTAQDWAVAPRNGAASQAASEAERSRPGSRLASGAGSPTRRSTHIDLDSRLPDSLTLGGRTGGAVLFAPPALAAAAQHLSGGNHDQHASHGSAASLGSSGSYAQLSDRYASGGAAPQAGAGEKGVLFSAAQQSWRPQEHSKQPGLPSRAWQPASDAQQPSAGGSAGNDDAVSPAGGSRVYGFSCRSGSAATVSRTAAGSGASALCMSVLFAAGISGNPCSWPACRQHAWQRCGFASPWRWRHRC